MTRTTRANELLGYLDNARLLIINADDFGMCHAVNEAVIRTFREGVVSSCTLMVPCPWSLHAVKLLQATPEMPFGVHLTVISEHADYRWGPLTCRDGVPSLTDEAGYFYSEAHAEEFLDRVDLSELEREYRAQLEWVLATGLKPTHLDSHCGSHTRREAIFEMTVGLAHEYGLALRVYGETFIDELQTRGYPTLDHELLDSYTLATTNKRATYIQMLKDLPVGLSEWAVHPGLDTAELRAIEPDSQVRPVRPTDFDFFSSQEAKDILEDEEIIVLDYSALQKVWRSIRYIEDVGFADLQISSCKNLPGLYLTV